MTKKLRNILKNGVSYFMKIMIFLPNHTLAIERGDTTHIKELVSNLSKFAEIDLIKADDKAITENVSLTVKALRIVKGLARGSLSILRKRPDLVYTRSSQDIFTFLLAKLFRLPFIIEINGLSADELKIAIGISWIRRWISYAKGLLNERTYKYADHLVAVTPKIKEVLEIEYKINPEKISVIENGANTELFRPMNTHEVRKELNLNQDNSYICFVGNLAEWQGIQYLIKASSHILEEYPNTFFLIVGDGPSRESLTKLAVQYGVSDNFIFTGMVPYEKIPLYINSSDLCVGPWVKERNQRCGVSPLKLYEYLACGKPVVVSRLPGLEIVEEYDCGYFVEPDNEHELAQMIIKLLKDAAARRQIGENGRRYIVEKNRNWESVAKRVFEVCQMLIKKH